MIAALLLLQAAQMEAEPPAVEAQPAVPRERSAGPALPVRPWLGTRSREAASRYWHCRRHNVGGLIPVEEGVDPRGDVWFMIYNQKVRCRSLRARLLTVFDRDLRAWLARTPPGGRGPGESEWALDMFERAIDEHLFSGFALGSADQEHAEDR